MKVSVLFAMVFAVLALLLSAGQAAPAPEPKIPFKKIGKVIKTAVGVLGAAGTAHEVYENVKNRG